MYCALLRRSCPTSESIGLELVWIILPPTVFISMFYILVKVGLYKQVFYAVVLNGSIFGFLALCVLFVQ
jgi:hypothetical protein